MLIVLHKKVIEEEIKVVLELYYKGN